MSNFSRAQFEYENRLPSDDEADYVECDECNGTGKLEVSKCCEEPQQDGRCAACGETWVAMPCDKCEGTGDCVAENWDRD